MNWKLTSLVCSFVIAIVALALTFSTRSKAQTAGPAPMAFEYKVERMNRNAKEMDRVLSNDGKDGWRVWRIEAVGPYHNDLVILLEKPVTTSSSAN